MMSCDIPEEGFDAGVELSCLDTDAMWRYLQTFMLSCQSTITNGLVNKPTNKIRPDVFTKVRDKELGYTQRTLVAKWDDTWYRYVYAKVCDVYPPEDYGRMYYNRLPDGTVDKHQKTYRWTGQKYEADSIFVVNMGKPSDVGTISYKPIGGERYIKQKLDYVFSDDEWQPVYSIIRAFAPPADHEAEYCNGYKLFVRKYNFNTETEKYDRHDYDFGYNEGSCGFTGYSFTGTSTGFDFSMVGSSNAISITNTVLKTHMSNSGVNIIMSDLGFKMNVDGSVDGFGGMYFSQDDILTFKGTNNILTLNMPNAITIGTLAFNPDGTVEGELFANINKSYTIDGQPDIYTVQDIKVIADGTNEIRIEINNGIDIESLGTIALTIT